MPLAWKTNVLQGEPWQTPAGTALQAEPGPRGNNNPRLLVFDYNWSSTAGSATQTTLFKDNPPLTFAAAGFTFTGPGS